MDPQLQFRVLTLIPDFFQAAINDGVFARAIQQGILSLTTHQLRDFSDRADRRVDDKPYGGGQGMVLRADILAHAIRHLKGPRTKVVFTTPSGNLFNSSIARSMAQEQDLLFVCGRYEGYDQRAVDAFADYQLSIGDYVLSGGDLAALVMMDAISRFVPGVLGNRLSAEHDSFEDGLLESPVFTRPESFEGVTVPPIVISGDHAKIAYYHRQEKVKRTAQFRPDLIKAQWNRLTPAERALAEEIFKLKPLQEQAHPSSSS